MFSFFFKHIFKHFSRSIAIVFSIFFVFLVGIFGIYAYQNVQAVIKHFSYLGNNPNRLTISADTNILNIFSKEEGLPEEKIQEIEQDENLENVQIFRLVQIPVSAKFWFFSFALESDIPVFSVTDSALENKKNIIPVGMSHTMVDLYNTQFAGSSKFFPQMSAEFLLGQKIEFTFGKSKIFNSTNNIATPITGTLSAINNDFPGFGIVLPESIVKQKLEEVGFSLGAPYKIVAYMKNSGLRDNIIKNHPGLNIRFSMDDIKKTEEKIMIAGLILWGIGSFLAGMFIVFFCFLLFGYFRERKNYFQMISLFGLKSYKSYILTIGEPLFFSIFGILFGIFVSIFFMQNIHPKLIQIIQEKWIFFNHISLSVWEILIFGIIVFVSFFILIFILDWKIRKKYEK